jgi:SAM-dependent methyltransferase
MLIFGSSIFSTVNMEIDSEYFELLSNCPVCSSPNFVLFKKSSFDSLSLSEEHIKITDSEYGQTWELSRCQECTHVFANPAPVPSLIQSLYSRVEDPDYEEEARGRGKNFRRILSRLDKLSTRKGRLLDVGAATGILVRLAKEKGWEAEGIEPSAWAVRFARDNYGLNLIEESFEAAGLEFETYSVVTMVDFIEHTARPLENLEKASRILAPDGILCLVTPDIASFTARLMGRRWWHFRPGHLSYFTSNSLEFLLGRAGFEILKKRKYSWTFSAYYLLSRKQALRYLIKNPRTALFWKRIPIKLALADSLEIYAVKRN